MRRFSLALQASRWALLASILVTIGGTAHAQKLGPIGPVNPVDGLRGVPKPRKLDLVPLVASATCTSIKFNVVIFQGTVQRPGVRVPFKVWVLDKVFGSFVLRQEFEVSLPETGGVAHFEVTWPMPADARFEPDFNNEITVVVDPENKVDELDKSNNTVTVVGTCLG